MFCSRETEIFGDAVTEYFLVIRHSLTGHCDGNRILGPLRM